MNSCYTTFFLKCREMTLHLGIALFFITLFPLNTQAQYWDEDGYYHEEDENVRYARYDQDEDFYERDPNWDHQHDRYRHDRSCNRQVCSRSCHYSGWNHRDHDRHCRRDKCYRSCKHYRRSSSSVYATPSTRAERVATGVIVGAVVLSAILDKSNGNHHSRYCNRQRCHSSCRRR